MSTQGFATPEAWYRALTLDERIDAKFPVSLCADPARLEAARKQLERWAAIPVLQQSPGRLSQRIAAAGLDEAGLMALLSESTKELAGREPRIPPSLAAACAAVEGFGAASFEIPDWLFTLKLER